MLEFAYTGEVNVAQDLLPTLLHTARSYRIKGLDKVESPVDPLQNRTDSHTSGSEHWAESAPPTRSHTPSSVHSQHDIKPQLASTEHFLAAAHSANEKSGNFLLNVANRERESQLNSR